MTKEQELEFCKAAAVLINRIGFVPLAGSPVPVGLAMTDHGMFHVYFPQSRKRYKAWISGEFTDTSVFEKMAINETEDLLDYRSWNTWSVHGDWDKVLLAFEKNMVEVNARPPTVEEIAADTWKPDKPKNEIVEKLKPIGWWIVGIIVALAFYFVVSLVFYLLGALVSWLSELI